MIICFIIRREQRVRKNRVSIEQSHPVYIVTYVFLGVVIPVLFYVEQPYLFLYAPSIQI